MNRDNYLSFLIDRCTIIVRRGILLHSAAMRYKADPSLALRMTICYISSCDGKY